MTMNELAKLANVSISTVSKAFYNADDVSESTKNHIFEIAKQNGCYGKFYKGKYYKKIIAIICHEIEGSYYSIFLNKLKKLIEASNGICIISTDDFDIKKQAELIEYYTSYLKVDALFVVSLLQQLKRGYDIPIIALLSSNDNNVDTINIDMDSAILNAIEKLKEYGHKNIAFIGEALTATKTIVFKNATTDINASIIESNERFEKAGIDGVKQLLEKKCKFTAIICAYDNIALGAIKELKKQGIKVPEDVSIVGIDNISASEYAETSLTTIDTKPEDVCEIAWDLMQKKLENKYYKATQTITLKPSLIIRESIRKINN